MMAQTPNGQTYQEDIHYDRDNYLDMEMAYRSVEQIVPRKRARKMFLRALAALVGMGLMGFGYLAWRPFAAFLEIGAALIIVALVCVFMGIRILVRGAQVSKMVGQEK